MLMLMIASKLASRGKIVVDFDEITERRIAYIFRCSI